VISSCKLIPQKGILECVLKYLNKIIMFLTSNNSIIIFLTPSFSEDVSSDSHNITYMAIVHRNAIYIPYIELINKIIDKIFRVA
jgi:hypothetical protein